MNGTAVKRVSTLVFSAIALMIYGTIFYFVLNMERQKCKCTEEPRRDIIKWYSGLSIVFTLVLPFINQKNRMLLMPISALLGMVFMVILFSYSHNLKHKKECECSNTWRREFIFKYSILSMILMVGMIILLLLSPEYFKQLYKSK